MFSNWVLIFFIVSIIWGLIWPEMKLILPNLNWSQNLEITLLNKFKYCFSGGWIIKCSSWLLMKKVLKEVPFSRLNSSSNLYFFLSKNLTQEKLLVISNSDKFWFSASKPILISDILKTYFLIVISNFSVMNCCLTW